MKNICFKKKSVWRRYTTLNFLCRDNLYFAQFSMLSLYFVCCKRILVVLHGKVTVTIVKSFVFRMRYFLCKCCYKNGLIQSWLRINVWRRPLGRISLWVTLLDKGTLRKGSIPGRMLRYWYMTEYQSSIVPETLIYFCIKVYYTYTFPRTVPDTVYVTNINNRTL